MRLARVKRHDHFRAKGIERPPHDHSLPLDPAVGEVRPRNQMGVPFKPAWQAIALAKLHFVCFRETAQARPKPVPIALASLRKNPNARHAGGIGYAFNDAAKSASTFSNRRKTRGKRSNATANAPATVAWQISIRRGRAAAAIVDFSLSSRFSCSSLEMIESPVGHRLEQASLEVQFFSCINSELLGFTERIGTGHAQRNDQDLGPFVLHLFDQIARFLDPQIYDEQGRTDCWRTASSRSGSTT